MAEKTMTKETIRMRTDYADMGVGAARHAFRVALALILAVVASGVLAGTAPASQEITEFEVAPTNAQAGAHPDISTRIRLDKPGQPEVARNVTIDFPAGVFGNPGAIYKCSGALFVTNACPPGTQAGVVAIISNYEGNPNFILGAAPVYNMVPVGEEEAARIAFVVPTINVPVTIPIQVRNDSDLGLRLSANSISQSLALTQANMSIWGFPSSEDHDIERFSPGKPGAPAGCPGVLTPSCLKAPFPSAGLVVRPYLDNPSLCTSGPLEVTAKVTTYQDPVPSEKVAYYPATTGCENQRFDPVFNLGLTNSESDSPSGLDIQLKANQFLAGTAPSPSTLRSGYLELPEGLSINPDAADGQTACSDAEARFGTLLPGNCPNSSKIGTLEVKTPALESPLPGSLYIGEPKPGNQYRAFMIFDGEGIHAKLAADFLPDPSTGRVTMSVEDIPQVPFEEFNLHLFASDRGLMATPTRCGIYEASATMIPWNATQSPQDSRPNVSITSGPGGKLCPGIVRPFAPRLVAGTTKPTAGDFSNFMLKLDRDDGDQFLGDLTFRMPPGFTGDLRGVSYCPESAILAAAGKAGRVEQISPSCPASSEVGSTNVAAGPGEHPFHAVGKMYLAGPLKGAPLSVVAITPALAGPYDYGVVVVRVALHVDPLTAQVFAASDTVPRIIGGIPIRMRSIQVNIDRERFTINPTNCSPFTVDSQGIGDQGTVTDFSSYFQVVNCATMPFKPRMAIRQLGGKGQTKRAKNPRLRFDLFTRPGDANIKSVAVTLPKAFAIDQRHLGNICSKAQLQAELCAGRQPIGHAVTETPLLDEPLSGPAYAVSGYGKLPHLAFILDGQVRIIPQAESASVKGGFLKTVVPVVPDAPIGHFRLTLLGGSKGYLVNTRDLCVAPARVTIEYAAQSGKSLTQRVRTKRPCGPQSSRRTRGSRRG